MTHNLPILYSFRRCPYAIRARLALASSEVKVELREILLRDKPQVFLEKSPSATVPCLALDTTVLDESIDIMRWALAQNDPEGLCDMPAAANDLIKTFDGPFKRALDLTKYAVRHPESDPDITRSDAMQILATLEDQLGDGWLYGNRPTLADLAALPFVRQFAMIDKSRFDCEATPNVLAWLETFLSSDRLSNVMQKYPPWKPGDAPLIYP